MPFDKSLKELHERSYQAGLKRLSKRTKFVHGTDDDETREIILPYENLLYVLSLFQQRTQESCQEARSILDRILQFQLHDGNFCQYIHEYPNNPNSLTALECLVPLFFIRKYFYPLLTIDEKHALSQSIDKLVQFLERVFYENQFPIWARIKYSALLLGLSYESGDTHFSDQEFVSKDLPLWFFEVSNLSKIMCVLSIKPFVEKNPNFVRFLTEFLQSSWCEKQKAYAGPNVRVMQTRNAPAVTLYDLYMGKLDVQRLKGAQVYTLEIPVVSPISPDFKFEGKDFSFTTIKKIQYTCTLLQTVNPDAKPFYLVSKNHTLALQIFRADLLSITSSDSHFVYTLRTHSENLSDVKDLRIFGLFINDDPEIQWSINQRKATAFFHEEKVILEFDDVKLTFWYEFNDPDTQKLMGHVNKSNRSFQMVGSNQQEFFAFDWQFFVRLVLQDAPIDVNLHIKIDEKL